MGLFIYLLRGGFMWLRINYNIASVPALCKSHRALHDTRHLCTRLFRTDGIKAMSRGFSGGKQVIKSANTRDRDRVFFVLDKRKWRTFFLEDANNKLLVEVFIVPLFESNSDRRFPFSMYNNDVKLVETPTVHFEWLLNRRLNLIE